MSHLSTLDEGVSIALDSIRVNKIRSSLTILGVSIGVGVVMMIAAMVTGIRVTTGALLGHIGDQEVRSSFAGELMAWLAVDTERGTSSQPIAWIRSD